jgi:hypothetical protein
MQLNGTKRLDTRLIKPEVIRISLEIIAQRLQYLAKAKYINTENNLFQIYFNTTIH